MFTVETLPNKLHVKIMDVEFTYHTTTMSALGSRHIQWVHNFNADEKDCVWFTDHTLDVAAGVELRKKIAMILEPPAVNEKSYRYIDNNIDVFDYVLTYSKELISKYPLKCLWFPSSTMWVKEIVIGHDKPKLVSMIASTKNETSGHKMRNEAVKALRGTSVEVFGRGRKFELEKKSDGLLPYKFSIVIENAKFDDYFTEKIIDCLATGTIPIYWGTKNIGNYFDYRSIIQFDTIDELVEIIKGIKHVRINDTAIQNNFFEAINNYYSTEDFIYSHYKFLFED